MKAICFGILILVLLAGCQSAEANPTPPIASNTTAIETRLPAAATATATLPPAVTAAPEATSTPLPLIHLVYGTQQFTSPETFQAGLGDLDLDIISGRFNGGAEIWFNNTIERNDT